MFKSKLLNTLILSMAGFIIVVLGVFYYLNHQTAKANDKPSASEIVDHLSVETDEMTTNLKDNKFIKVKFLMQVSDKKAKEELTDRQFQVKNAILYLLSNQTENGLQGKKGLAHLENAIKSKLNGKMENGQIVHVYTTEKIIQ